MSEAECRRVFNVVICGVQTTNSYFLKWTTNQFFCVEQEKFYLVAGLVTT